MLCLRCGNPNPPGTNYCTRCNAVLPRLGGDAATPASSLDVEDGREYLVPQRSFPTEFLYHLTCRAYEYIHEEAPGEPLLEAYEVVRSALERFEAGDLPDLLARFQQERERTPEDDYGSQMAYLVNRGVQMMREGFDLMDAFIADGDVETLKSAVARMQEGNDNLGLARELSASRKRRR